MSKTFMKAVFAGGAVSLGGIANILSGNKIAGSLFFVIGLFLVLTTNLNLFTGKICYFVTKDIGVKDLIIIYLGNFCGAGLTGTIFSLLPKYQININNYSIEFMNRITAPIWQIFILAFFCNILIYIAVNGYNTQNQEWKKAASLIFGVSIFVLCGFEHSIADIFYISFCNLWSIDSILFLFCVTIGNIFGGIFIPLIKKYFID